MSNVSNDLDDMLNGDPLPDKGGFLNIVKDCATCEGKGYGTKLKMPCPSCNGSGQIKTEVTMDTMELFLRRQVDKFRRQGKIPPKDEE